MPTESRGASAARARGNRQRTRTRAALITAGQRLFASRAMESVTIDEIVEVAEVAKGSFYNHFDDKAALARAIHELVQGDVEFHIFSANQDVQDPPLRMARALCTVVRYAVDHPDRLNALLSLSARGTGAASPLNTGLSADLRNGIEQGRFTPIDLEVGILVVIGLANVAVSYAALRSAQSVDALASGMASAVLRALGMSPSEAEAIGSAAAVDVLEMKLGG